MGSMDAELHRKPTKARPARPRLRGAACRRPRRPQVETDSAPQGPSGRGQMRLAAMPATVASGNGPDTTERAPLDARGWVPSAFRARPANDKESGRAMPATPRKKVDAPCRRRPERNATSSVLQSLALVCEALQFKTKLKINHLRSSPGPPELAGFYVDSHCDVDAATHEPLP